MPAEVTGVVPGNLLAPGFRRGLISRCRQIQHVNQELGNILHLLGELFVSLLPLWSVGQKLGIVLKRRGAGGTVRDNIVQALKGFNVGVSHSPAGVKVTRPQKYRCPAAPLLPGDDDLNAVPGQEVNYVPAQLRKDKVGHTADEIAHRHRGLNTVGGYVHHRNRLP
ncbi:hypothetical protein ES708_28510 [subsurface metagenome]